MFESFLPNSVFVYYYYGQKIKTFPCLRYFLALLCTHVLVLSSRATHMCILTLYSSGTMCSWVCDVEMCMAVCMHKRCHKHENMNNYEKYTTVPVMPIGTNTNTHVQLCILTCQATATKWSSPIFCQLAIQYNIFEWYMGTYAT